jgi:ribosome maturation factor RimP
VPEREMIAAAIEPVLTTLGLELFDIQFTGAGRARTVRVVVDRDGGVDLDAISATAERISPVLEEHHELGSYALEVSSPGLERPLHRPEHFRRAVGEKVSVKVRGADGEVRRVRGELLGADEQGVTVGKADDGAAERVDYDRIVQARTVFEWGAAAASGKAENKRDNKREKKSKKKNTTKKKQKEVSR